MPVFEERVQSPTFSGWPLAVQWICNLTENLTEIKTNGLLFYEEVTKRNA